MHGVSFAASVAEFIYQPIDVSSTAANRTKRPNNISSTATGKKKHFTRAARRLPREKAKKKTLQKKRNSRGHSQKWRKDFVDVTQYGPISTTATAPPSFRVPDIFMGRASYLFDFISFFFPSQHRQIYLFCSLNPSSIISERIFGKVIPHLVEEIVVKYSLRPRCW